MFSILLAYHCYVSKTNNQLGDTWLFVPFLTLRESGSMVKALEIQSPSKFSKYAKVFGTTHVQTCPAVQKYGRTDK